ncbi:glycosyltransferase, partial [uncultured Flavobacterium sp.]|uniref:glycosyltransferase n=1 Tax=uncultured Flavobacterium sp. TaxID=165435 RepID=UPI0030CA4527
MLSILIPTYNHNVFPLVVELFSQVNKLKIDYEILVLDDGSTQYVEENLKISTLKNC